MARIAKRKPVIVDGIQKAAEPFEYIKDIVDEDKSMASSFRCIINIPGKKSGTGTIICLAKELLPLADDIWILPAH
ncbi:MAG: hypothetical protein FWD78_15510 [Treponema sp.]|nr:hypothetical protein [Treponema sp.]